MNVARVALAVVGAFVVHNYVNLNIGLSLTVPQAVVYCLEWVIVGMAIGVIDRPPVQ
jgi:flagellar biosynthesis protein FliR